MNPPEACDTAPLTDVTALVLAGGLGRRMGGEDKGLVDLAGRPMIEFVLDALRPQVGRVLINANRNLERYAAYGHTVVADRHQGFLGPLAGVLSGLEESGSRYLLTAPWPATGSVSNRCSCCSMVRSGRDSKRSWPAADEKSTHGSRA